MNEQTKPTNKPTTEMSETANTILAEYANLKEWPGPSNIYV
jgi:hypothetical protein